MGDVIFEIDVQIVAANERPATTENAAARMPTRGQNGASFVEDETQEASRNMRQELEELEPEVLYGSGLRFSLC